MLQNYFIANGGKYYTGTVIIVEHLGKQVEASFMYYDVDMNKYFSFPSNLLFQNQVVSQSNSLACKFHLDRFLQLHYMLRMKKL